MRASQGFPANRMLWENAGIVSEGKRIALGNTCFSTVKECSTTEISSHQSHSQSEVDPDPLTLTTSDGQGKREEERTKQIVKLKRQKYFCGLVFGEDSLPCCSTYVKLQKCLSVVQIICCYMDNKFQRTFSLNLQVYKHSFCITISMILENIYISLFEVLVLLLYFARRKVQQVFAQSCKKILEFKVTLSHKCFGFWCSLFLARQLLVVGQAPYWYVSQSKGAN